MFSFPNGTVDDVREKATGNALLPRGLMSGACMIACMLSTVAKGFRLKSTSKNIPFNCRFCVGVCLRVEMLYVVFFDGHERIKVKQT